MKFSLIAIAVLIELIAFCQTTNIIVPEDRMSFETDNSLDYPGKEYLDKYYNQDGASVSKDSVDCFEDGSYFGRTEIQNYSGGIKHYKHFWCYEPGVFSSIEFLSNDINSIKELIEKIVYSKNNRWISETEYEPVNTEVGWGASFEQKEDTITVLIQKHIFWENNWENGQLVEKKGQSIFDKEYEPIEIIPSESALFCESIMGTSLENLTDEKGNPIYPAYKADSDFWVFDMIPRFDDWRILEYDSTQLVYKEGRPFSGRLLACNEKDIVVLTCDLKKGLKHGQYSLYSNDGAPFMDAKFKRGEWEWFSIYRGDGTLDKKVVFDNSRSNYTINEYYGSGSKYVETQVINDQMTNSRAFHENGNVKATFELDITTKKINAHYFNENGVLYEKGTFKIDDDDHWVKEGVWSSLNDQGKVVTRKYYRNDEVYNCEGLDCDE